MSDHARWVLGAGTCVSVTVRMADSFFHDLFNEQLFHNRTACTNSLVLLEGTTLKRNASA